MPVYLSQTVPHPHQEVALILDFGLIIPLLLFVVLPLYISLDTMLFSSVFEIYVNRIHDSYTTFCCMIHQIDTYDCISFISMSLPYLSIPVYGWLYLLLQFLLFL